MPKLQMSTLQPRVWKTPLRSNTVIFSWATAGGAGMQAQVLCSQSLVLASSPQSSLQRECELRPFTEAPWPRAQHWSRQSQREVARSTCELSNVALRAAHSHHQEALFLSGRTYPVAQEQWKDSPGFAPERSGFPWMLFLPQEKLRSQRATECCLLPARSSPCEHRRFLKRVCPKLHLQQHMHIVELRWLLGPKLPASLPNCHIPDLTVFKGPAWSSSSVNSQVAFYQLSVGPFSPMVGTTWSIT